MTNDWQWLGYGGTAIVVIAYLPQIRHLTREHCSAGLSVWAYSMWAASAMFLLVYAISLGDGVFIALQSYQLFAAILICFYCAKYKHSPCENHLRRKLPIRSEDLTAGGKSAVTGDRGSRNFALQ